MRKWLEKPYHSLDYMLQDRFKEKVYKITLNGIMLIYCAVLRRMQRGKWSVFFLLEKRR